MPLSLGAGWSVAVPDPVVVPAAHSTGSGRWQGGAGLRLDKGRGRRGVRVWGGITGYRAGGEREGGRRCDLEGCLIIRIDQPEIAHWNRIRCTKYHPLFANRGALYENTVMFDIRLMRHDGIRLAADEMAKQLAHTGDFVLDQANGAKRLRIKSPWASAYAAVELYDPVLVSARNGVMVFRGFERSADRGVVQEWLVRDH